MCKKLIIMLYFLVLPGYIRSQEAKALTGKSVKRTVSELRKESEDLKSKILFDVKGKKGHQINKECPFESLHFSMKDVNGDLPTMSIRTGVIATVAAMGATLLLDQRKYKSEITAIQRAWVGGLMVAVTRDICNKSTVQATGYIAGSATGAFAFAMPAICEFYGACTGVIVGAAAGGLMGMSSKTFSPNINVTKCIESGVFVAGNLFAGAGYALGVLESTRIIVPEVFDIVPKLHTIKVSALVS